MPPTPHKIAILFGTRPEVIKLAPLVLELQASPKFQTTVILTGQHREMLMPLLELFNIRIDHDLQVDQEQPQSLSQLVSHILKGMDRTLNSSFAGLLIQGDTASCLAGSLWGFFSKVPVFHIEAGLRTGDLNSPWPEEFNRRVTTIASALHFAPTENSRQNLLDEKVPDQNIFVVGNTVIDALINVSSRLDSDRELREATGKTFPFLNPKKKLVLATVHRRESFGPKIDGIFSALKTLAEDPDLQVVLPLHLNPNVRSSADRILINSKVHIIEPQSYLPFVYLMKHADLILTDSGGIQEEAPSLGKRVLVLRETSERLESVEAGYCKVVGTDRDTIVNETMKSLKLEPLTPLLTGPFGDGTAAKKIIRVLQQNFEQV